MSPIFAHSEKRIRITYTEVLPLRGGRYRYRYALQSELLKQHPLRELAIDVRIHSALPLKNVTCPTHDCRTDRTAHSAHVELSAPEYTPQSDFEVEVEVDHRAAPVVLVPHRRGGDGYFLLLLTPPRVGRDWHREILPDGDPLQLLVLADTSGSMDPANRKAQDAFVAALLSSLGEKDTFNLATSDVTCQWFSKEPLPAIERNILAARDFLAARRSLGWTDLDQAFAAVSRRPGTGTHVVYVGDGTPTAKDADPVAFAERLKRRHPGRSGTFHAVATGNSYESVVLKAISSLGGGSFRRIEGRDGARAAAHQLLSEISQPTIRDVRVALRGLRTARVYPAELPNLPAGSQQIRLGRYLPEGRDVVGEAIVKGTRAGKPVQFRTSASLKDAEAGNSFIPRLWARMHLDALLAQGRSQSIREEIIALSEEYHILTPYTSFLVLESDADRERFKVKRRFRMRDGERFFAAGRDTANFELRRKQMRLAGNWRLDLREHVLRQYARLGRDSDMLCPRNEAPYGAPTVGAWGKECLELLRGMGNEESRLAQLYDAGDVVWHWAGMHATLGSGMGSEMPEDAEHERREAGAIPPRLGALPDDGEGPFSQLLLARRPRSETYDAARVVAAGTDLAILAGLLRRDWYHGHHEFRIDWLDVMPLVPEPPRHDELAERSRDWPTPARQLSESLLRCESLASLKTGLEIRCVSENYSYASPRVPVMEECTVLISGERWLTRRSKDAGQTLINWCDREERGIVAPCFGLGMRRRSVPADRTGYTLPLQDRSLRSLEREYHNCRPDLESKGQDRVLLKLTDRYDLASEAVVTIDKEREVILSIEDGRYGDVTRTKTFTGFVQAAGRWWATRVEVRDARGRRLSSSTLRIRELGGDELQKRLDDEMKPCQAAITIRVPIPTIPEAKNAIASGGATIEDHLVGIHHFGTLDQWGRADDHLGQMQRLVPGKVGLWWVRDAILTYSRRREDRLQRVLRFAEQLAEGGTTDELYLANYLLEHVRYTVHDNERLALLDVLKPVYHRQEPRTFATKQWREKRASLLSSTGRTEAAFELRRSNAADFPLDVGAQLHYVSGLAGREGYSAAYAWLDRLLAQKDQWHPSERERLRRQYMGLYRAQGRVPDAVTFLDEWLATEPESGLPYSAYLMALRQTGQIEKADELAARWLEEGLATAERSAAATARVEAAVRATEVRRDLVATIVRQFVRHRTHGRLAGSVMGNPGFQKTEAYRDLREELVQSLLQTPDKLCVGRIRLAVKWLRDGLPKLDRETWRKIAARLERRWAAEQDPFECHKLGRVLVDILWPHGTSASRLAFLRRQWRAGPRDYRTAYACRLFPALLHEPWSQQNEDEAFALLSHLCGSRAPDTRLADQVQALHSLVDSMVEARYRQSVSLAERDQTLSRMQRRTLRSRKLRDARVALANRLEQEVERQDESLRPWLAIERLHLRTLCQADSQAIVQECWQRLGEHPPGEGSLKRLDGIRFLRYLRIIECLAATPGADPELAERLLRYYDRGIAASPKGRVWKLAKYRLLLALDRPQELERLLRAWAEPGRPGNLWRLVLGYLLAETDRVPEAIRQFEAAGVEDELGAGEYQALANWYLVVNERQKHEDAVAQSLMARGEWSLRAELDEILRSRQEPTGTGAREIDVDVVAMSKAIFRTATESVDHLDQLVSLYGHTRDARLLECLPEGVIGHTALRVYELLGEMQCILDQIHDEAAADALFEHLAKVRQRAVSDVDLRALDLLEMQVARRAVEVSNRPEPHVRRALGALRRAFARDWAPGERRLMASLLAGLGRIGHEPLAREQLRQLAAVHRAEKDASDRLHIANDWASALRGYEQWDPALDTLEAALDEYREREARPSESYEARPVFDAFVSYLAHGGYHTRAESVLVAELGKRTPGQGPASPMRLRLQLYPLYNRALSAGGTVSLGRGPDLYKAVHAMILTDLDRQDHWHHGELVSQLCCLYRAAHKRGLPGVPDDLKTFAWQRSRKLRPVPTRRGAGPGAIPFPALDHQSIPATVAQELHDLVGPREALAYLVECIEKEPTWLRHIGQDGWPRHCSSLAAWRAEAKALGDLEGRLLKIVEGALRRDLTAQLGTSRAVYDRRHSGFWEKKLDTFAGVAEEVLASQGSSGKAVKHVAGYLWEGLGLHEQAIRALVAARKRGTLEEDGLSLLAQYLSDEERQTEAVPVLEALVRWRPRSVDYRGRLMEGYFHTGQKARLVDLLEESDRFFREADEWNKATIVALAEACMTTRLYGRSAAYYQQLVSLCERRNWPRRAKQKALSEYWSNIADAYARLGRAADAIEAACTAIVGAGSDDESRSRAIERLGQSLAAAPNLDEYAAVLDKHVRAAGLENPIVRKALGQVYLERREHAKAIAQLQHAVAIQPGDAEIHRALVAAYDQQGDKQGATQRLLELAQLSRRDIDLYKDLGDRCAALDQPTDAERAYTTIIEMLPNESGSHALLAKIRQRQNRWAEAIPHWRQVTCIRSLDPTGYLNLAEAQMHERRWDAARKTIETVLSKRWPPGSGDVHRNARELLSRMP